MKSLLLICALCATSFSFSQDSFFRVDGGIGAAFTAGNFSAYGISASSEPKFFFNENISVGLRLEGDVLFGGKIDGDHGDVNIKMSTRAAYLAKGEYYFGKGNTKPFVGLMAGMYTQANVGVSVSGSSAGTSISAVRTFGFAPQVGFAFGNFRISGMYHVVPGKELVNITTSTGGIEAVSVGHNYWVVQMGFRIFGYNDK